MAMRVVAWNSVLLSFDSSAANGNTTTYSYDDAGRRTTVTDAIGNVTTFGYDTAGNQKTVLDARGNTTTYVYDKDNRRTTLIYPDATTDITGYDQVGRNASKTDQAGKVTQYGYDPDGRLTSVTDALSHITKYGYDEIGEEITQTDALGRVTKFAYDKLGRRTKRTLPLGQFETYTYDVAGNLKTHTDFNGKTTTYGYDSMNRLLSKTPDASFSSVAGFPSGTFSNPITFTYSATGRRQTMTDPSGTTVYTYDVRDRLQTKQTPFGTLTYSYDNSGNVLSVSSSNQNGVNTSYTYDIDERLSTVTDNASLVTGSTRPASGTTTYSYDAAGNLGGFLYPNNVQTTYGYDTLNRLTNMTIAQVTGSGSGGSGGSGTNLASYMYTLGAAGNRKSVTELSGRTVTYGYDDLYRLTSETIASDPFAANNGSISYTYDDVGNRTSRTSTIAAVPTNPLVQVDANDRLMTDGYDNNGSTITSGGNTYAYDFENHIIAVNPTSSNPITILYDGDGNRVSKTVGTGSSAVTTRFLVDDNNLTGYAQVVEELTSIPGGPPSSGAVSRTYAYGAMLVSQTQSNVSAWTTSFYGLDGHGSVRFLMDSSGNVTDTYDDDAFGILIHGTGSTANLYLYSGEQFDPDLGLYYQRARYLNTQTARFMSIDSYEGTRSDPVSLHKYLYCAGSPIDATDPSGHESLNEMLQVALITNILAAISVVSLGVASASYHNFSLDGVMLSFRGNFTFSRFYVGGGLDVLYQISNHKFFYAATGELGTAPLALFKKHRGLGFSVSLSLIVGMNDPNEMSGWGVAAVLPLTLFRYLPGAAFSELKAWGAMLQLAIKDTYPSFKHFSVGVGLSSSGPSYMTIGVRSNAFSTLVSYSSGFKTGGDVVDGLREIASPLLDLISAGAFNTSDSIGSNSEAILSALQGAN